MKNKIVCFTDGSVHPNPNGDGGYAYCIVDGDKIIQEGACYEGNTTNNRMEMRAAIEGIKQAQKLGYDELEIRSDSSYLINCFRQKWYIKWQNNGWKNSQSKPVENKDLWEELLKVNKEVKVNWIHVKGHVGTFYNERVDDMAGKVRISKTDWHSNGNNS